jgi:hypothetical protein
MVNLMVVVEPRLRLVSPDLNQILHLRSSQFAFLSVVDCKTKLELFRVPFQAPRPSLIFQQMLVENFAKMTSQGPLFAHL